MDFVCKETFDSVISSLFEGRQGKKPLWTGKRIEEAIKMVEKFNSGSTLGRPRTSKEYYYGNKYEVLDRGLHKSLALKRKSSSDPIVEIVPPEDFHRILCEIHEATKHRGRDKMLHILRTKYLIPYPVIAQFLKLCKICRTKKYPRKGDVTRPILTFDFHSRGQIELIDFQSTPDGQYKWLLHYQDQATRFSYLRPLTSNHPSEVATELLKIFLEAGCPLILQSVIGREFTAEVIKELSTLWPTCKIIISKHSVEQLWDQDVKAMLHEWAVTSNTKSWAIGCYFVQFKKNTTYHPRMKRTPFEALFGTEAKKGLITSGKIPDYLKKQLHTEEDLESYLKQQCGSQLESYSRNIPTVKKLCYVCEKETKESYTCDVCNNTVHSTCQKKVEDDENGSKVLCDLCEQESLQMNREHDDNQMDLVSVKVEEMPIVKLEEIKIGYTVLVDVPELDRGSTNGSSILGRVIDKSGDLFKVETSAGVIKDWLPRGSLQISYSKFSVPVPIIEITLGELAANSFGRC